MMNKNIKFVFLILLLLSGCSYVVLEVRSVPSLTIWDGEDDIKVYRPREISNVVQLEEAEVYIYLNNYSEEYSGLEIIGFEVKRDPNQQSKWATGGDIVLMLGIKNKNLENELVVDASKIQLFYFENGDENPIHPVKVFYQGTLAACKYDYDGFVRGGQSKLLSEPLTIRAAKNSKDEGYQCFNIIFYPAIDFTKKIIGLDFSTSGIFDGKIYFHPKKIRWSQSN